MLILMAGNCLNLYFGCLNLTDFLLRSDYLVRLPQELAANLTPPAFYILFLLDNRKLLLAG